LDPNPSTHSFPLSLMPRRYFCTKTGHWDRKPSNLSSSSLIPCQYHSLSHLSNHFIPTIQVPWKEAMCRSPGAMLFYKQVLLLTCQGHTFTWSTTATHMHPAVHTYEESPDHFFLIYTPFPLFIPFTLDKQSKFALKLQKYQQPCPTLRKKISPWIHHDFHQEIAYDVHNSLYNMIGYFSWQNLWIYHNNPAFYGQKSSNNVWSSPPSNPISKRIKAANSRVIL
jgi:hypothetical protein